MGRRIFYRSTGLFQLIVEAKPGLNGRAVGKTLLHPTPSQRPDLQIENNVPMGTPTPGVVYCRATPGITPGMWGGIAGVSPPSFGPDQSISDALQNFACFFSAHNPADQFSVCTLNTYGVASAIVVDSFGNPLATQQFCDPVDSRAPFPPGESLLSVQVLDSAGTPGPTVQVVIRVATPTPTP